MRKVSKILIMSIVFSQAFLLPISANEKDKKVIEIPEVEVGEVVTVEVGDAEYIESINGNLIRIDDLKSFDNQEDADKFINEMNSEVNVETTITNDKARSTSRDILIGRHTFWSSTVDLRLKYVTSGNSNTGYIVSMDPYTSHYGVTLGQEWNQKTISATKLNGGKDISVVATGECILYLFVNGLVEVTRERVTLGGVVTAIR